MRLAKFLPNYILIRELNLSYQRPASDFVTGTTKHKNLTWDRTYPRSISLTQEILIQRPISEICRNQASVIAGRRKAGPGLIGGDQVGKRHSVNAWRDRCRTAANSLNLER